MVYGDRGFANKFKSANLRDYTHSAAHRDGCDWESVW